MRWWAVGQVLAVQTCEPVFRRHTYVKSGHGSGFCTSVLASWGRKSSPISERPCLTNWVERAEGEAKLFNKLIAPIYFIFYLFCLLSAGNYCFWFLTEYISNNQDICPSSTACLIEDRQNFSLFFFFSTVSRKWVWTDIVSAYPFFPGRVFICLTSIYKLLAIHKTILICIALSNKYREL